MVATDDPFASPKSRLSRAKTHIAELKRQIKAFFDDKPHEFIRELDPDGIHETFKLRFTKELPEGCTHLAIEILEALRSVLDQIAYGAARASGNTKLKQTQFLIGDDEAAYQRLVDRHLSEDVPEVIRALFRSFKPYKGGNDALWALNKLRNSNHTRLVPVGVGGALIYVKEGSVEFPGSAAPFDRSKNEIELMRGAIGEQRNRQIAPTFVVAFDEIEAIGGRAPLDILTESCRWIEYILAATESECRRAGFI